MTWYILFAINTLAGIFGKLKEVYIVVKMTIKFTISYRNCELFVKTKVLL